MANNIYNKHQGKVSNQDSIEILLLLRDLEIPQLKFMNSKAKVYGHYIRNILSGLYGLRKIL